MSKKNSWLVVVIALVIISAIVYISLGRKVGKEVVIYTSVDQVFSEPVLKAFEKDTGIKVLPVYDIEAAKTTGLVNRLIAEKGAPKADVFWNGEFAQTMLLKEKGILAAYKSPAAEGIPAQYADAEGYWTGFGGRARVILANKNLLSPEQYPKRPYWEQLTFQGLLLPDPGISSSQALPFQPHQEHHPYLSDPQPAVR